MTSSCTWIDAGERGYQYRRRRDDGRLGFGVDEVAGLGQEDAEHHEGRAAKLPPRRVPAQDELGKIKVGLKVSQARDISMCHFNQIFFLYVVRMVNWESLSQ